jgi:SAM-dependent methyltransferase
MLEQLLRLPGAGTAYWHLKWKTTPRRRPEPMLQNGVLKTRAEWERAMARVKDLGLPVRDDPPKNWDSLAALHAILEHVGPHGRVLDAGVQTYSTILPWLAVYGYDNLVGNNLVFKGPMRVGPIRYEPGDITKMRYEDSSFDAITCLSVIEHNVDVSKFLREAARTLVPGGLLILSTDYFDPPIDTRGHVAYGGPVKVFCAAEIEKLLAEARELGLVPTTSPIDLSCEEKCVTWSRFGLQYTFLLLTLRKVAKE